LLDGFFLVTYVLGIFLLNNFIGFLSPLEDPEVRMNNLIIISSLIQLSVDWGRSLASH